MFSPEHNFRLKLQIRIIRAAKPGWQIPHLTSHEAIKAVKSQSTHKTGNSKAKKTKGKSKHSRGFTKRHGLSLVSAAVLVLWVILYSISDEQKRWGSFFGNAIADWSGVLVVILATKHLYEKGSAESKIEPGLPLHSRVLERLRQHSLSIFLVITGSAWVVLFAHSNPQGKWGQVVGNIVSEWTQILGLVLMTKKLVEAGSEESSKGDES